MNTPFYDLTTFWVIAVNLVVALATLWLFKIGEASNRTLAWVANIVA